MAGRWARAWASGLMGLLAMAPAAMAEILPEPTVSEYEPAAVEQELSRFEAVGDGIVLTLAVCDEQPHCVTAMSEHELARVIDRIQERIDHLVAMREEGELEAPYDRFLGDYRALRDRYAEYLLQVRRVNVEIDPQTLEQDWEDILDFGFTDDFDVDTGPEVPSPNDQLTLERFQDANDPLPVD